MMTREDIEGRLRAVVNTDEDASDAIESAIRQNVEIPPGHYKALRVLSPAMSRRLRMTPWGPNVSLRQGQPWRLGMEGRVFAEGYKP